MGHEWKLAAEFRRLNPGGSIAYYTWAHGLLTIDPSMFPLIHHILMGLSRFSWFAQGLTLTCLSHSVTIFYV